MQDLMQEYCIRFIFYKFSQNGKMIAGDLVNFLSHVTPEAGLCHHYTR